MITQQEVLMILEVVEGEFRKDSPLAKILSDESRHFVQARKFAEEGRVIWAANRLLMAFTSAIGKQLNTEQNGGEMPLILVFMVLFDVLKKESENTPCGTTETAEKSNVVCIARR